MAKKKQVSKSKYDYKKLAKAKQLSEKELNALLRYINNKDENNVVYDIFNSNKAVYDATGIKLSKEQSNKGFKWLYNLGYTPTGNERKNSPFGYREQYIVKNPKEIRIRGLYDVSGFLGSRFLIPLYEAIGKDGTTMEYYLDYKGISIVG